MPDQLTKERIDQEVHTANHAKIYEQNKTKPKPEPTYTELKASHDNHYFNNQKAMPYPHFITDIGIII